MYSSIYTFFIALLRIGIWLGSFFNSKLKKGWQGRKESLHKIQQTFSPDDQIIWMHAASLGEYEQGLPVLSKLKLKYPQHKILITFFSPSGYENVIKKKNIADVICYLPFDRKKEIKRFLAPMKVDLFFTVKYEYWYHLLAELKARKTKLFVVSALFYPNQVFFKAYGGFFVHQLKKNIHWFFHQNQSSCDLAKSIGLEKSSVSGDTRYDRVKENLEKVDEVPFIKEFINGEKCVVFGSSWEAEEKIAEMITKKSNCTIIIAPHDLKRVAHLLKMFQNATLYSKLKEQNSELNSENSKLLIIDRIGLLSKLYSYADVSVVGGGFHSAGLHNILESAVFGNPVLFGNHYKNHPEAEDLIQAKGGSTFSTENQLSNEVLNLLNHAEKRELMSQNAKNFIFKQPNSSELIVDKIINKCNF